MSTGSVSPNSRSPRRERMVIGERVLDDVEPPLAQVAKEPSRIADARDRVHALPRETLQRPLRRRRRTRQAFPATGHRARAAVRPRGCRRREDRAPAAPLTTIMSARCSARRGSRNGPAGSSRPLPKPRAPSTTTISQSRASCRCCRPSSATITSTPCCDEQPARAATRSRPDHRQATRAAAQQQGSSPTSRQLESGSTRRGSSRGRPSAVTARHDANSQPAR